MNVVETGTIAFKNFTRVLMSQKPLQLVEDIEKYGSTAAVRVKLERDYLNENQGELNTMGTL